MDIVEFAEKVYGHPISDIHKDILTKIYEARQNGIQIIYKPARGCCRYDHELLESIAILFLGYEEGVIKFIR